MIHVGWGDYLAIDVQVDQTIEFVLAETRRDVVVLGTVFSASTTDSRFDSDFALTMQPLVLCVGRFHRIPLMLLVLVFRVIVLPFRAG